MTDDWKDTRRDLIALRVAHGTDSAIGHRCSNIIEILQNMAEATDPQRVMGLRAQLKKQTDDLERFRSGFQ